MKPALLRCLALLLLLCAAIPVHADENPEVAVLKTGGRPAQALIQKARGILQHTPMFANGGVGYAGAPTSTGWALTVVVRHDPKAAEFFEQLYQSADHPEGRLYAVVGLLILDPAQKKRFQPAQLPAALRDTVVHEMSGCSPFDSFFAEAVKSQLKNGPELCLYRDLPPFKSTTDVAKWR